MSTTNKNDTNQNLQKLPADQLKRHVSSLRKRIAAEEEDANKIDAKRSKFYEEIYGIEQQPSQD